MTDVIDFLPFYPLTAQKIEIKKYTKNYDQMMYGS